MNLLWVHTVLVTSAALFRYVRSLEGVITIQGDHGGDHTDTIGTVSGMDLHDLNTDPDIPKCDASSYEECDKWSTSGFNLAPIRRSGDELRDGEEAVLIASGSGKGYLQIGMCDSRCTVIGIDGFTYSGFEPVFGYSIYTTKSDHPSDLDVFIQSYQGHKIFEDGLQFKFVARRKNNIFEVWLSGTGQYSGQFQYASTGIRKTQRFLKLSTEFSAKVAFESTGLRADLESGGSVLTSPVLAGRGGLACVSLRYAFRPQGGVVERSALLLSTRTASRWEPRAVLHAASASDWRHRAVQAVLLPRPVEPWVLSVSADRGVYIAEVAGCTLKQGDEVLIESYISPQLPLALPTDAVKWSNLPYTSSESTYLTCHNGGYLSHPRFSSCICPPGFNGRECTKACGPDQFGKDCSMRCSNSSRGCSQVFICSSQTGCSCAPGWKGRTCQQPCGINEYGAGCSQRCGSCAGQGEGCDPYSGRCPEGCRSGYAAPLCQKELERLIKPPNVTAVTNSSVSGSVLVSKRNVAGASSTTFIEINYKEWSPSGFTGRWLTACTLRAERDVPVHFEIPDLLQGVRYAVRAVLLDSYLQGVRSEDLPYTTASTQGTRLITNVTISTVDPWTLNVSWWSSDPKSSFVVFYECQRLLSYCPAAASCALSSGLQSLQSLQSLGAVGSGLVSVLLERLLPGAVYGVSVAQGEARRDRVWNWGWQNGTGATAFTKPGHSPRAVAGVAPLLTNTTASLEWRSAGREACEDSNGPPAWAFHWQLWQLLTGGGSPLLRDEGDTRLGQLVLRGLRPHTAYRLHVFSVNADGWEQHYPLHIHFTTTATPNADPPLRLRSDRRASDSVLLHWELPQLLGGDLHFFNVTVSETECGGEDRGGLRPRREEKLPAEEELPGYAHLVLGLRPACSHAVTVALGPRGHPAKLSEVTTRPVAPSVPSVPSVPHLQLEGQRAERVRVRVRPAERAASSASDTLLRGYLLIILSENGLGQHHNIAEVDLAVELSNKLNTTTFDVVRHWETSGPHSLPEAGEVVAVGGVAEAGATLTSLTGPYPWGRLRPAPPLHPHQRVAVAAVAQYKQLFGVSVAVATIEHEVVAVQTEASGNGSDWPDAARSGSAAAISWSNAVAVCAVHVWACCTRMIRI